ncbi:hypothetical protein BWI93_24970 [Siphonobacter sp. BAB-5385]|uniref:hypothetical protein n=1 Tax=Siphonobacter sp. BAB-5385 TaxID=1864822 RepID=UPI000B9E4263|nr:hypothetical protein [Siphonobacter sp. BAB-5385]OZI05520.1 hypothetical protein BWI93_24970 [Siphonobacter sp. BAB-5385]
MQNILLHALMALLVVATGCKKNNDSDPDDNSSTDADGFTSFTMDGKQYQGDGFSPLLSDVSRIDVWGVFPTSSSFWIDIKFAMPNPKAVATNIFLPFSERHIERAYVAF